MNVINEKLEKLYFENQKTFESIVSDFRGNDIAGPLLMSIQDNYLERENRLLIVGQETNGWGYYSSKIVEGMENYARFNFGSNYKSSPFWNVTRKIEHLLSNPKFSCAWTNVSKFDVDGNMPIGENAKLISKVDDLLKEEIKILNPTMVIFFTGPKLDSRLLKLFPNISFEEGSLGLNKRQFAKLKHELLPASTFRTYHPKYLRIKGLENLVLENIKKF
jgi:hypothetical protein